MSTHTEVQPDTQDERDPDDSVEVRRDGALSAVVGAVAAAVALAYLVRATGTGGGLDWLLALAIGAVAALHLAALADSRAPLFVLDRHGVRVRRGRAWEGVAWPEVDRVEHHPRQSLLRDGRLDVIDMDGRTLGVRLSLSTRLIGADWDELTAALEELTEGRTDVVEVVPATPAPQPTLERPVEDEAQHDQPEPVEPGREPVAGRRTELILEPRPKAEPDDNTAMVPTARAHAVPLDADPGSDETLVTLVTVVEPVVGPVLAAARVRLGLTVDQLADRTRIRPHVIECLEVDDFAPCGGDFYARGHLRTLSRVLGVEVGPLLTEYDKRYADAPIDPRRVFETELATGAGGPIRATRGGMNWSVLVAAVMAVVLVWSVARLVMDHPTPDAHRIVLNGSPSGGKASLSNATTKVPVEITAATGGARVIVRDADQKVVFDDQLPFMGTADLRVAPPVRISSSDGGLQVSIDGQDKGAIGSTGADAQQVYVP